MAYLNRSLFRSNKGLNLIEVLIVIVIIAILVALAIPTYTKTIESTKDREAKTTLRLIRTGEKIYRLETGFYYPYSGTVTDITQINSNLKLDIDTEAAWDFEVRYLPGDDFRGRAERKAPYPSGYDRTWRIQKDGTITQE